MLQICSALNAAHLAGIVHRDLKPPNVFITSSPRLPQFVKLLDFGIAKLKSDLRATGIQTGAGGVMGTFQYMAPEQAEAPMTVDHRADIFALGCIIYQVFAGRLAYPDREPDGRRGVRELDYTEILAAQRAGVLPPSLTQLRADLDPRWEAIVARCLAYDRAQRYPNVRALALDIAAATPEGGAIFAEVWADFAATPEDMTVRNDGLVPPRRGPLTPPPPSSPRLTSHAAAAGARASTSPGRGRRWWLVVGVAVVAMLASVAIVVTRDGGGDPRDEVRDDEKYRLAEKMKGTPDDAWLKADYEAAEKLERAARVKPVGGKLPRNHAYAGETYDYDDIRSRNPGDPEAAELAIEDLKTRGLDGIQFDEDGYPELEPVVYREGDVAADVQIEMSGKRRTDFRRADAAMREKLGDPRWRRPRDYTWHHHQESGRMILVPADIHAVIDHTGGVAAYRATTGDFTAYDSRRTQPGDEGETVDEHD